MVSENIFLPDKPHIFLPFLQHSIRTRPLREYFYKCHWKQVVESAPSFPDQVIADRQLSDAENFFLTASALLNSRLVRLSPGKIFQELFEVKTESPYYHQLLKFAFSWAEVINLCRLCSSLGWNSWYVVKQEVLVSRVCISDMGGNRY